MNPKQPPPDPDLSNIQGDNYWIDNLGPILVVIILLILLCVETYKWW